MEFFILALFASLCSSYNAFSLAPQGSCLLPVDEGPCNATSCRYFYNTFTQNCEVFNYGGCQGNANNFRSYLECMLTCFRIPEVPQVCRFPKEKGPCKGCFPRYFFNMTSMQCELFTYGGCRGNANRFKDLISCRRSCAFTSPRSDNILPVGGSELLLEVPQVCRLPKVVGPCKARIPQYFFNMTSMQCELFYYGGCGGNANRFLDLTSCKQRCDFISPCSDNVSSVGGSELELGMGHGL